MTRRAAPRDVMKRDTTSRARRNRLIAAVIHSCTPHVASVRKSVSLSLSLSLSQFPAGYRIFFLLTLDSVSDFYSVGIRAVKLSVSAAGAKMEIEFPRIVKALITHRTK